MVEIASPRTPSPGVNGFKAAFMSPPPRPGNLTPPPTSEISRHGPNFPATDAQQYHETRGAQRQRRFPTVEEARKLAPDECRDLVLELLPAIGEARMALAHTQLQLNLLSIDSAEASQRAEVEHDMTRREMEVLRAGSPLLRARVPILNDPTSPMAQIQRQLEIAIQAGRELEVDNYQLHHRLRQAKKVIKHLHGKNAQLLDDNHLLRERIKQNRDHMDAIHASNLYTLGSSPASAQPRSKHSRTDRTPGKTPLDALLMADQILSGDPSSVPATPTPYRAMKYGSAHVRGTQSLSSLPTTPTRPRPMTTAEILATPVNRIISSSHPIYSTPTKQQTSGPVERAREDRDGTISASENEVLTDEDIPASQASRAASSMLRQNPDSSPEYKQKSSLRKPQKYMQGRLGGKISKPKSGSNQKTPQYISDSEGAEYERPAKRTRMDRNGERTLGLGIRTWESPR